VHDFAAEVVRPAAAEWDEKEEFPWPVLEEAAKIGLYSLDFFATQSFDETGLGIPIAMEELFWGDAGIGLSIVGAALAAAGVSSNGTPEQVGGHCCIERSEHDVAGRFPADGDVGMACRFD